MPKPDDRLFTKALARGPIPALAIKPLAPPGGGTSGPRKCRVIPIVARGTDVNERQSPEVAMGGLSIFEANQKT